MKNWKEQCMRILFFLSALASILAVVLICLFLFAYGLPAIAKIGAAPFLLGNDWSPTDSPPSFGILPMIVGSLYITAGAVLLSAPIGILTAVYLSCVCPKQWYRFLKPSLSLLAGIPSTVYGFFGLVAIVPLVRQLFGGTGQSILTASILLAIMVLPTIIGISEAALRAVPSSYYEGALALGADHYRSIFFVILPGAKSGIFAGLILGIGRAIGETMAVVMVAGNQGRIPSSILEGVRTLTANIVIEMGYASGLHREALIATGVVLFIFILLINLSLSFMKRRSES